MGEPLNPVAASELGKGVQPRGPDEI